jgi:hypothetical protein
MQTYLSTMAELFKLAAMYNDRSLTGILATLLEMSMQPKAAWRYWCQHSHKFMAVADTILLQDIDDYLKEKARD